MKRVLILAFLLTACCLLPSAVRAQGTPGTVRCPSQTDTLDSLFRIKDQARTVLAGAITSSSSTITVGSTGSFPSSGSIKIDSEVVYYSSKTSTTFGTLVRGASGTVAASHANSALVTSPILAAHHNTLAEAIICTQQKALDADVVAIGALTPANDDIIQRKSGAWTNRTPAQFKIDLALSNVDDTSDVNKPVSTAQAVADALNLKIASNLADLNNAATARGNLGAAASGANTDITSLAGVASITGGASNMTITSGTGNSRTMIFRTTTSGGTATAALTLGADQAADFAGKIKVNGTQALYLPDQLLFFGSLVVGSGGGSLSNTVEDEGGHNTLIGIASGFSMTRGAHNTGVGSLSLFSNTTGNDNTATGYGALYSNTSGAENVAVGWNALRLSTTGNYNTAIGTDSLPVNTTGSYNAAVGIQALYKITTGTGNVGVGFNAGAGSGVLDEGSTVDTYSNFIGYQASRDSSVLTTTVLTNATAIGKAAKVGTSNTIVLGGTGANAVNVGIGVVAPAAQFHTTGSVRFANFGAGIATLDSSGNVASSPGSTAITTVGTIATGTWQGSIISSTYGGTGINNGGRTLAVNTNSGTLAFSGASKTLTIAKSITIDGTDGTAMTFPSTSATIARTDAGNMFTGNQGITGKLTSYDGITTEGEGVAVVVESYDSGDQTAAMGPTTIFTAPAADGFYEIMGQVVVTGAATSGTIFPSITWTDANTNVANTISGSPSGQVSSVSAIGRTGAFTIKVKASTAIQLSTGFTSVVGTPTYKVFVIVKKVG